MSDGPLYLAPVAVGPEPPGTEADESPNPVTKCGRCRLNFVLHPSIVPGDSPKWWLCPSCRTRPLGDESKTSSRRGRSDIRPRNLANPRSDGRQRVQEITRNANRDEGGPWSTAQ